MKLLTALLSILLSGSALAKTPDYQLGIVIVVDQFRADYLMRFKDDFLPSSGATGGYRFLMEKGAYFPLADHELFQNMTCPGHAAILSGSYPYRNQIVMNTWYDRENQKPLYCVQDESTKIIGTDGVVAGMRGISPRNFVGTTVGDELKNVDRASRVVSLSIKDRAAVLMGGKRTDATVWLDDKNCQWVSSSYFTKELPAFAKKQNAHLATLKNQKISWGPTKDAAYCSRESIQTPWGVEETFNLARAAIDEYKLGQGKDTDILAISLSSHDYLGHLLGPNSPYMKDMTLAEDKEIAAFLKDVAAKVPGGLKNVFVVLTGDHGMPPSPKALPPERIPTENVTENELRDLAETTLTKEFGSPKGGKWVEAISELQLYLNQEAVTADKIPLARIGEVLRARLVKERYIDSVWMRDEIMYDRKVPAGETGRVLDRTISRRSGDVLIVVKPFFYSDAGAAISHMTHYSYDRYVPLILWGKSFKPGTYRQTARIIDIAPTLSSILQVLPPVQSEGRVMTEILH